MPAPRLPELQRAFAAAIVDGDAAALTPWIQPRGIAPAARLRIYRNAVFAIQVEALATTFPAVRAALGEAALDGLATRYAAGGKSQRQSSKGGRRVRGIPRCASRNRAPPMAGSAGAAGMGASTKRAGRGLAAGRSERIDRRARRGRRRSVPAAATARAGGVGGSAGTGFVASCAATGRSGGSRRRPATCAAMARRRRGCHARDRRGAGCVRARADAGTDADGGFRKRASVRRAGSGELAAPAARTRADRGRVDIPDHPESASMSVRKAMAI